MYVTMTILSFFPNKIQDKGSILKIIVTGATDHIGSYLIRELGFQFKESEIVMIDNMMTQRFSSLLNSQKLEIIPLLKVMLD